MLKLVQTIYFIKMERATMEGERREPGTKSQRRGQGGREWNGKVPYLAKKGVHAAPSFSPRF